MSQQIHPIALLSTYMAKSSGFQSSLDIDEAGESCHDAIALESLSIEFVTLEELNFTLPIGIFVEGQRFNTFKLKPYRTRHDRILGEILARPKVNLVSALQDFYPEIIEEIGGLPIAEVAAKLSVSVSRLCTGLYLGDALAILLAIRMAAQGSLIKMAATCPACSTHNEDRGTMASPFHDIAGLDIPVIPTLEQKPVFSVLLKDGLVIGNETIKRVHMEPLKLHQFQALTKQGSSDAYDIAMLYAMVTALPDSRYYSKAKGQVFSAELYDELTMADLEILRDAMEKLQLTPKMVAEMTCYNCTHSWEAALPWGQLRQFLFVPPKSA